MKSPSASARKSLAKKGAEAHSTFLDLIKHCAPSDIGAKVSDEGRQELEARMFNRPSCKPPVNNAIVPDIYDKLDAQARERTRVMNSVLNQRYTVQENVIRRHRSLSEKYHSREQAKVKGELRIIEKCLPNLVKIYKDTRIESLERNKDSVVHVTKQLPSLPSENHFCYRYYDHHNPAKIAQKISNDIRKSMEAADRSLRSMAVDGRSRDLLVARMRASVDSLNLRHDTVPSRKSQTVGRENTPNKSYTTQKTSNSECDVANEIPNDPRENADVVRDSDTTDGVRCANLESRTNESDDDVFENCKTPPG